MDKPKVEVVQADRDRAASLYAQGPGAIDVVYEAIANGQHDDIPLVQAFARHRLSHSPITGDVSGRAREEAAALRLLERRFDAHFAKTARDHGLDEWHVAIGDARTALGLPQEEPSDG